MPITTEHPAACDRRVWTGRRPLLRRQAPCGVKSPEPGPRLGCPDRETRASRGPAPRSTCAAPRGCSGQPLRAAGGGGRPCPVLPWDGPARRPPPGSRRKPRVRRPGATRRLSSRVARVQRSSPLAGFAFSQTPGCDPLCAWPGRPHLGTGACWAVAACGLTGHLRLRVAAALPGTTVASLGVGGLRPPTRCRGSGSRELTRAGVPGTCRRRSGVSAAPGLPQGKGRGSRTRGA